MISEYSPVFISLSAIIYLFVAILSDSFKNKKIDYILSFLMVIMYVVILGLRDYSIGSDTEAYVSNFINGNRNFEFLFTLFTDVIRSFTDNPSNYLLILSIIYGINIFIAYFIFGRNVNSQIIIFIFFVLFSQAMLTGTINYFRQSLGFSFLLIGLALYTVKNRLNLIILLLFLASVLIHNANIILIFCIIFFRFFSLRTALLFLLLSLFLFLLGFGDYIVNNFSNYYIIQRTLARHIYFNVRRSETTIYLNILMYMFHLAIFLYFYKKDNNFFFRRLIKTYISIFSLSIFMSFNRELAIRHYIMLQYLIPILYMCILSSNVISNSFKSLVKIFFIFYTLLYLFYLLNRSWFVDQFIGNIIH
ncbi:EpsG family protein [Arsenophonus nasoniae]|uniref:EpsG family protein n=1 Tax=Arsenophonus nasoniae TaxID=638 RepID=A0AA95K7Y7_9GAMM|nr:EpsG family protein [Arsenophonus nasoniae]WGL95357.1 EpsG family protein [Arsenophonus nasoniae]